MLSGAEPKREIWVVCERRDGRLYRGSLELLGKASELSRRPGWSAAAVLFGPDLGSSVREAASAGADTIYAIENDSVDACSDGDVSCAVSDLAEEFHPEVVLLSATIRGRSVAPQTAARLHTGLAADCLTLSLDPAGRLLQTRPAYGDRFVAEVICPKAFPQMATVRPGVFTMPNPDNRRVGKVVPFTPKSRSAGRLRLLSRTGAGRDGVSLQDARVIVAGGRGVGSADGFLKLRELAELLGGAAGASRSAVDAGYAPYEMQIGQSGKIVHPKLYIACGISGSVQHLAGMSFSGFIIAVNNDRKAPIFDHADYGILGDVSAVLDAIIEETKVRIKKMK